MRAIRRIGRTSQYFKDVWTWVDWATIVGGVGVGGFFGYLAGVVGTLSGDLELQSKVSRGGKFEARTIKHHPVSNP